MKNRARALGLLSSCALLAPAAVFAQTADDVAATTEMAEAEIVVYGRGETRQVQELDGAALTILAAGTSPLKAIEKLPSVNFQSADPFGNYEWSQRISIRGFNQNQLGYTLDGIPLGDFTYGNHNGVHISRAIAPENIGVTRVSQGAGSIGANSTNNLGGTLEFFSVDPFDALGLDVDATYGSENTIRGFGRFNIGSADGARAFISGVYHDAEKWKGEGSQRNWTVNAKAIVPVGSVEFDAYFSYSDRAEQDYQDLSLDIIDRLGFEWDNFFPDFATAVLVADVAANRSAAGLSGGSGATPLNPAAGTVFPAPIATVDDAYYDASGLRKDTLAAVGVTLPVAEGASIKVKAYYHENDGQGTWGTPYVPSPNGIPLSVRTTEYDLQRTGVFANLSAEVGMHNVSAGAWFENNDFIQARRFYAYASRTNPGYSHRDFAENPFFTQWEIDFNTKTFQYHVQDKISLGDLTVNLGWKGFDVRNEANAIVQGGRATGEISVTDWFQPHVGAAYKINDNAEVFGGFTQATRAFVSSTTSGPFSTTQAGFAAIQDTLEPEESDTYELGARYNDSIVNAVVGVYLVNFRNRLLGITTGAGIVGNPSVLQNVGSVRSYGFEAAGDVRLGNGITVFASYSYTDATYRDDVVNAAGVVVAATAGKTVVDTPKHLVRGEIAYDSDTFFGRIGGNFNSKRFFNFLNDRSVGSRLLVDATLGYRFDIGAREPVEIQLNATNLFDKRYVATIGSNGFGNSGDNQTLLAGAPQQFFVTLRAGF